MMMWQVCFAIGMLVSPALFAASAALSPADCVKLQALEVITAANPVPCERWQRESFLRLNMNGQITEGQLIVFDVVAPQVEALMAALLKAQFPLQSALPLEQFQGKDELSMNANNSSAFNGRPITGGKSWSKHAYGVAIDINPLQNPYVNVSDEGSVTVLPAASAKAFLNRDEMRPEKPQRAGLLNESIANLFAQFGFMTWGGDWDNPIDYQHFEIGSRTFINALLQQPFATAQANFNQYATSYRQCVGSESGSVAEIRARCVAKVRK